MKKIITGKAQTRATRERLERFPGFPAAILSGSDLSVSPLGFGSYRVHINIEEHRKALAHALRNGVNLIDTSANYTDGGSEMLIGSVLRELTESGELRREEVVIISKAGYIQGQNLSRLQQRRPGGDAFPEIIHYQQGLDHCIHPDFLEEQLTLSLERLQCDTIDYFLLHNPEYFLFDARRRGIPPQEARKTYYERIDRAF
ncbi:MAG TPA: aldo/keto reductase, partial [Caldithrix abyssi]|nr:aldo/keto reductase [Caldithrix abyssi]